MVVCALFRMTGLQMVENVAIRDDGKYQKMYVDFKQDIQTEASRRFFVNILKGKNQFGYDEREYWTTHFIPMPKPPILKSTRYFAEKHVDPGHPIQYITQPIELTQDEMKDKLKDKMKDWFLKNGVPTIKKLEAELDELQSEKMELEKETKRISSSAEWKP